MFNLHKALIIHLRLRTGIAHLNQTSCSHKKKCPRILHCSTQLSMDNNYIQ